ncbi:MAG: hypothetical protein J0L67_00345 [Cytophagales bacterium]|jgi:hypothetical protein|nr:hypothetical protein [Cytophagales bacterium]
MDGIDIGLYIMYIFFFVAVGAAIVLPLINAIKSPAGLGKSLAGVAVLVVIFLISYALADGSVTARYTLMGVDESSSKLIGAGLILFYIVFVAAIIGVIFSEINKALK